MMIGFFALVDTLQEFRRRAIVVEEGFLGKAEEGSQATMSCVATSSDLEKVMFFMLPL